MTAEGLAELLKKPATDSRVVLAVTTANVQIEQWAEQFPLEDGTIPPAPVTPPLEQAGLELAHTLYRRHAAVGGVFAMDEILSRLPADLVRPIRDLIDTETHGWGLA